MKQNDLLDLTYSFQPDLYFVEKEKGNISQSEDKLIIPSFVEYLAHKLTSSNFIPQVLIFINKSKQLTNSSERLAILLQLLEHSHQHEKVQGLVNHVLLDHVQQYELTDKDLEQIREYKELICREFFVYLFYYTVEFQQQVISNPSYYQSNEYHFNYGRPHIFVIQDKGLFRIKNKYLLPLVSQLRTTFSDNMVDIEFVLYDDLILEEFDFFKQQLKSLYHINNKIRITLSEVTAYREVLTNPTLLKKAQYLINRFLISSYTKIKDPYNIVFINLEGSFYLPSINSKKELKTLLWVLPIYFKSKP